MEIMFVILFAVTLLTVRFYRQTKKLKSKNSALENYIKQTAVETGQLRVMMDHFSKTLTAYFEEKNEPVECSESV